MKEISCRVLVSSWIFIISGFVLYHSFGLLMSILPFAIAAVLRGDHDRSIKENTRKNQKLLAIVALYYLGLSIYTIAKIEFWGTLSGVQFMLVLFSPIFLIIIVKEVHNVKIRRGLNYLRLV